MTADGAPPRPSDPAVIQAAGPAVIGRRGLLVGAPAAWLCAAGGPAAAARSEAHSEAHRDFAGPLPVEAEADAPPGLGTGRPSRRHALLRGTRRASDVEEAVAARVAAGVPSTSPLAVMLHFEKLTTVNRDGEAYNAGWRTRWNPVIVGFFRETATVPSGDTTAWCAASLNWALARCGYAGGTDSASSGSFRGVRGRTRHPRPGDVVVFGATDPAAFARGQGHVGLFLAETADRVLVLGGNQKNVAGHQAVCRKWLAKRDEERTLQSYHAVGALRSAA